MTNCKYCKADCCNKGLDHNLEKGCRGYIPMTNGDRFRAKTDEELANGLFQLYMATTEQNFGDISTHWCDNKGECAGSDEFFACSDERHKACILRWLKKKMEDDGDG